MMTKFKAVNRMRGVLIGGFSSRFTIDLTESACIVGIVGWPVALAWKLLYVALPRDPEVRDHLRARGPELHEFDRREGLLLVPPDRERGSAGRDLLAVRRLDAVAFHRGPVEDRVRNRDLLAASLPEHHGE